MARRKEILDRIPRTEVLDRIPRKEILDQIQKYVHPFRITKGENFRLKDFDPAETSGLKLDKGETAELIERGIAWLAEEQDMLYAQDRQFSQNRTLLLLLARRRWINGSCKKCGRFGNTKGNRLSGWPQEQIFPIVLQRRRGDLHNCCSAGVRF